jgi:hypothetical protein
MTIRVYDLPASNSKIEFAGSYGGEKKKIETRYAVP